MRRFLKIYFTIFSLIVYTLSVSGFAPQYSDGKTDLKLRWNAGTIPISFSDSLFKPNPNVKADSDVSGAVKRSLQSWEKISNINFKETTSEKQSVSPSGNFGDGVSLVTIAQTPENILLFSGDSESVSAITRVFFNKKGVITEADIVLNPYQQFSTDGTVGTFDLESTLTHEIGHLLGLEHSSILGATMHESSGKNGVFNLSSYDSRTLAETDITAIRAIYGMKEEDENCCGAISGKLFLSDGKTAKNYQLWAEEFESGKVSAEYAANPDGSFHFESLPTGKYKVYAQNVSKIKGFKTAEEIGVAEVVKGKTANITKKLDQMPIDFQVQYVGFNGQLSENSVTLNAGKSYTVYVGGKNININDYKIGFSSPLMTITPNTLFEHDFGENISVLSFEVNIKPEIALGEYNIYVESEKGQRSFVLGGLTIEEFENPWSNYSLANNQY